MLVAAGCPLDTPDHEGATALHVAAGGDLANPIALRVLIELGATVDAIDHAGNTPLTVAAMVGDGPSVRVLLNAGANPHHQNRDGARPLELVPVPNPNEPPAPDGASPRLREMFARIHQTYLASNTEARQLLEAATQHPH